MTFTGNIVEENRKKIVNSETLATPDTQDTGRR
jgi:hypothetical protein